MGDLDAKDRKYPDSKSTQPLTSMVGLKENSPAELQRLVKHMFGKIVLVEDYQTALYVAQQFNLTTITPDFQMVHAGAFLAKVGQYSGKAERVFIYEKLKVLQTEVESKQD